MREIKYQISINQKFDNLDEMEWAILARATNILREIFKGTEKSKELEWMDVMLFTAIGKGKSWDANLLAYAKKLNPN